MRLNLLFFKNLQTEDYSQTNSKVKVYTGDEMICGKYKESPSPLTKMLYETSAMLTHLDHVYMISISLIIGNNLFSNVLMYHMKSLFRLTYTESLVAV